MVIRLLMLCVMLMCAGNGVAKALPNQDKPIRIVTNNWTSQIVLAKVAGGLFASMGYQVEYVPTSTADQWGALRHGAAHVQVEVWEGTMSDMFSRMVNSGGMVDAGTHDAKTREEWWYPAYVEDVCPGLPDWKALKACAALFQAPDMNDGVGVYFAGPWEKPDAARIRALGLNFRVNVLKNGDDLWVQLKAAAKVQRPIVLFNWTPNWVESRFEGRFIEFPDHAPACETDPSWGVSKEFLYDCGNPKGGWLKKAAWSGMEAQWQCAFRTLKNMNVDNIHIASAAALVDVDNLTHDQAAARWLEENNALSNSWIPADCL